MSIVKSDLESQARTNLRRRGRSISEASNLNLLSLSDFLSEDRNLLSLSDFRKPSPKPKRRGRKANPNPRRWRWRWGRLSREDWGKLSPKEKEDWGKLSLTERRELLLLIKKEAERSMNTKKAEQLFISDASVTPNTTKEELSASTSEITFTKEELSVPPTSEMLDRIYGPDAEWIAELQSRNNKCGLCACTNHLTSMCSYFEEIPPDAKILNETIIRIVCKYCSLPFKNGTCLSKCLPPIRRKAIHKSIEVIPKSRKVIPYPFGKELFVAPPTSEMVVHSSSEETTTPCIHDLSTSPSLKLSGELHAGATTPPFAFPYMPALALSS